MRTDKFLILEGKSRRGFGRRRLCLYHCGVYGVYWNVSASKEDKNREKEYEKEEGTDRPIEKDTKKEREREVEETRETGAYVVISRWMLRDQ